jgi:hypothetical protein
MSEEYCFGYVERTITYFKQKIKPLIKINEMCERRHWNENLVLISVIGMVFSGMRNNVEIMKKRIKQ